MGARERHPGATILTIAAMFAITAVLIGWTATAPADSPDATVTASLTRDRVAVRGGGPVGRAMPGLVGRPLISRPDNAPVWRVPPAGAAPRAETLLWDNGAPLDDFGDPASQWSPPPAVPLWRFIAAAADDFALYDYSAPDENLRITRVRAAFVFFKEGAETASPALTWTGIHVTVYGNSLLDQPGGVPDDMGGHTGNVIANQFVDATALTETAPGAEECRPYWMVDIPVNFVLAKNTRYWLSLVPEFPAPPQTAWCISEESRGFDAHRGASFGTVLFWTQIEGNSGCPDDADCPPECDSVSNPPAGTNKDLSFQLHGDVLDPNFGACCDLATGTCQDDLTEAECLAVGPYVEFHPAAVCQFVECETVAGACCDDGTAGCTVENIADCPPAWRFAPGLTCGELYPVCGTDYPGACCFPDQSCLDLTPTDCSNTGDGGVWNEGECVAFQCPPPNDPCDGAIAVTDGLHVFNTLGATTDGPPIEPTSGCPEIELDVWFRYISECDGTLFVSLCFEDTDFDSELAVYDNCRCTPTESEQVACNDDGCGIAGGPSEVFFPVISGECYLIRIGSDAPVTGSGLLAVACLPTGMGACCHEDMVCEHMFEEDCIEPGDTFFPGLPCLLVECPESLECCTGDADGNNVRNGLDIQPFIQSLMAPPETGTVEFCRADVDENLVIDIDDIAPFVQKLLTAEPCSLVCCRGDTNDDGSLDGLDIQGLVEAILSPPESGTLEFCRADVDKSGVIDQFDVEALVQKLITGEQCSEAPLSCCPGDMNGDGALDGLDEQLLIEALLDPPAPGTMDFCHADVDEDGDIDLDDLDTFISLLLSGAVCPPENDDCADAFTITDGLTAFTTLGASTDGLAHPSSECNLDMSGGQVDLDIWYLYTATCTGNLRVEVCNDGVASPGDADYDSRIAVYDTCACAEASDATLLDCNDDDVACSGGSSDLTVPVVVDTCYLIRIGGAGPAEGSGNVNITCTP
ncbi:MAG: dockerin type I domain-containing protein [Planctomycetota bacterium]